MTQVQQPEALRLAEMYDFGDPAAHGNAWKSAVCTELRSQHARIAELEAQLSASQPAAQGMDAPNEWEDIRTLPTCDDLIWLYCQDSNTIDGPIAPEPNLEEYGWSHWAYANAPSTVWIDAAQAR